MIDIKERIINALEKERKIYPVNSNRASELGHPCLRYLVFLRTRWQEQTTPHVSVLLRLMHGEIYERVAKNLIEKSNLIVVEQSRCYEWKAYQITGKIDFKIALNHKEAIPVEVKGLNPYDFQTINCIEDLLMHKKYWIRKYPAQLTLYMLMDNVEKGLFFIIDKSSFDFKCIWLDLDYVYAEELIKKAEMVNYYAASNTTPEGINDIEICQQCSFLHVCLPEIKGIEIEIISDDELEAMLRRYDELKEAVKEYDQIQKIIKKQIEGKEKVLIGNFLITGKYVKRKGYTVHDTEYWHWKIMKIENKKKEESNEQSLGNTK